MLVKVTAMLASPLALSADGVPPHLDAICEYAIAGKALSIAQSSGGHKHPIAHDMPGQPVSKQGTLPIPIKRTWVDCGGGLKVPLPHCSQGILPTCNERAEHFHKSFPIGRARMLNAKSQTVLDAGGGAYKSHRLPLRIVDASCVVWFAELRRKDGRAPASELRTRLRREVGAIGKKTSQGFGVVSQWIVEPSQTPAHWIAEGVLMRPMPSGMVPECTKGARPDFGAVSSPYWQRDFWCERHVPIDE
jgi:hypothetical protein